MSQSTADIHKIWRYKIVIQGMNKQKTNYDTNNNNTVFVQHINV